MRNYYLFETALQVNSVFALEKGLNNMNDILLSRDSKRDNFICNSTVWECNTTQGKIYELFGGIVNKELQRVIPFIFNSFKEYPQAYNNPSEMDSDFPADCNGYIGFEFSHTTIHIDKRVNDQITYKTFVAKCLKFGIISNTNELKFNLSILYPDFDFSDRALDECLNWKKENIGLYERLYDLLDDIPNNPFMGGIGETEVLKNLKGVSSKRINQAHRITYKLANKRVSILACSGHYN